MADELYDFNTQISCVQLAEFMHDIWMAITKSDSVFEVEMHLDTIDDNIGKALAPCIGYEVLNGLTDNWDSNSKVLDAIKSDAKLKAETLHREGLDGITEGDKLTSAKFNMLLKRIDQLGSDPFKKRIKGRDLTASETLYDTFSIGINSKDVIKVSEVLEEGNYADDRDIARKAGVDVLTTRKILSQLEKSGMVEFE